MGGGSTTSSAAGEPSPSTESPFRMSGSISDLTSLPSDYQGSPQSNHTAGASIVLQSSTTRERPDVPLANGKKRRIVMDSVSIPHFQWHPTQEPALSDRSSSSMLDDTTAINIDEHGQPDDSAGSSNTRPLKKQRIAILSDELPRRFPIRLEKR